MTCETSERVRRARPRDRPVLSRLQTHLSEPSPELLDHVLRVVGDSSDAGTRGLADVAGEILVTTAGGVPVGYLLAIHGDETHLAELVVAPDHRREGRARALLHALFDRLPADRRVTVAVSPENDAARSLYETVGFSLVERNPDFFENGAALLLERTGDAETSESETDRKR